MTPNKNIEKISVNFLFSAILIIINLLIIIWVLYYTKYGFDFTDESFYLNNISNPFIYNTSITLFGFFYHPFYLILNEDIAQLRIFNVLINFTLAWIFSYLLIKELVINMIKNNYQLLIISFNLASTVFIFFKLWIITPSYNSLALQSLLLAAIGILFISSQDLKKKNVGFLIIGISGWMMFMAKPSSALALAVFILIYLLITKQLSKIGFVITVTSSIILVLLSIFVIDGSITRFINRFKLGLEYAGLLGGGHTFIQILRIDKFNIDSSLIVTIFCIFLTSNFSIVLTLLKNKIFSILFYFILLIGLIFLYNNYYKISINISNFIVLSIFGFLLSFLTIYLILLKYNLVQKISALQFSLSILFLCFPHIFAFGTNGNYWLKGGLVAIFWLMAGLIFLTPIAIKKCSWSFILSLLLVIHAYTILMMKIGIENPHRQSQSLSMHDSEVTIGTSNSKLLVSASSAKLINDAQAISKIAGFKNGTPMLDLSGQSPGILYAIGAEAISQAWMIGGYPGSLNLAKASLKQVSCEKIAAAWILYEAKGPRRISAELLESVGLKFPDNFKKTGEWETAEGSRGKGKLLIQELYMPISSENNYKKCAIKRFNDNQVGIIAD